MYNFEDTEKGINSRDRKGKEMRFATAETASFDNSFNRGKDNPYAI